MESSSIKKIVNKRKRALRNRNNLRGSLAKPRLCVVKTNKHIHAQLIDDESAVTLASTSTLAKEFRGGEFAKKNKTSAKALGLKMAELAQQKNVKKIVFDRGSAKYHGVLASFADGVREGGVEV